MGLRWCGSPFLLLFDGHPCFESPHPAFALTLDLFKSLMLQKIMTDATLPAHSGDDEFEVGVLSRNGAVYLVKRHWSLALFSVLRERLVDKHHIRSSWLG